MSSDEPKESKSLVKEPDSHVASDHSKESVGGGGDEVILDIQVPKIHKIKKNPVDGRRYETHKGARIRIYKSGRWNADSTDESRRAIIASQVFSVTDGEVPDLM